MSLVCNWFQGLKLFIHFIQLINILVTFLIEMLCDFPGFAFNLKIIINCKNNFIINILFLFKLIINLDYLI